MGRNLMNFKKFLMRSSLIPMYDIIILILMLRQLRNGKSSLFLFLWIMLKFGVKGNFSLLSSNLNSKTQYLFAILRKCHFSSIGS